MIQYAKRNLYFKVLRPKSSHKEEKIACFMKTYSLRNFNQQVLIGHSCVPIAAFNFNKDSEDIRQWFSNLACPRITWRAY
jgi:hypothetical protein